MGMHPHDGIGPMEGSQKSCSLTFPLHVGKDARRGWLLSEPDTVAPGSQPPASKGEVNTYCLQLPYPCSVKATKYTETISQARGLPPLQSSLPLADRPK